MKKQDIMIKVNDKRTLSWEEIMGSFKKDQIVKWTEPIESEDETSEDRMVVLEDSTPNEHGAEYVYVMTLGTGLPIAPTARYFASELKEAV